MSTLEGSLRDDLGPKPPRATAVLPPLKLIIDNFPQGEALECTSPVHPHFPERGLRAFPIMRELWIEQDDFIEVPSKCYFRFYPLIGEAPGSRVRRSAPVRPPVQRPEPGPRQQGLQGALNPNALEVVTAYLKPGTSAALPDQRFQFERHGYFVADRVESKPGRPVLNRITTLKDSWTK